MRTMQAPSRGKPTHRPLSTRKCAPVPTYWAASTSDPSTARTTAGFRRCRDGRRIRARQETTQ